MGTTRTNKQRVSLFVRASGSPGDNAVNNKDVSVLTWSKRQCSSAFVSLKHNLAIWKIFPMKAVLKWLHIAWRLWKKFLWAN